MPSVVVEIPDTYNAITRPVIIEVARNLMEVMGLPNDTSLQFLGASDSGIQPGSTLTKPKENNSFPHTNKITIEASEQYIEDRVLATAVKRKENKVFFIDPELRVSLYPVYVGTEITLSVRFRAQDRVTAERWRDEFRIRTSQGRGELLHNLNYNYGIPPQYLTILSEIHTLRENVAGYGEDIQTWVRKCITNKVTKLTTQAGTEPTLVIGEQQVGVLGWFEFVANPETGAKAGEGGAWETGFDYKFVYDKVIATAFNYPLTVHNQLLDERLRPHKAVYDLVQEYRAPSLTGHVTEQYNKIFKDERKTGLGGVSIPDFDEWVPKYVQPFTTTILSALMVVDLDDPKNLLNLGELGDFQLDPDILTFMSGEAKYMNLTNQSIFHVSLFNWEYPLNDTSITVDENLNVTSRLNLNPRNQYHFRLALSSDFTVLSKGAIERLRNNPDAFFEIIKILDPAFSQTCYTPFYERLGFSPETKLLALFESLPEGLSEDTVLKDLFCSTLLSELLETNPDLYAKVKKMINDLLVAVGLLPKPIGGKIVSIKDTQEIVRRISKHVIKNPAQIEHRLKTVGQYVIIARKE